jgi:hypothetical protein
MAQRGVPAGRDSPADRPSVLRITVESDSRPRATVRRPHVLIAIVVLAAIGAAIVVAVRPGGGGGSTPPPPTPAPQTPAPVQPSVLVQSGPPSATLPRLYRFPLGCRSSAPTGIQSGRPSSCSRDRLYVTAVMQQIRGGWRVTLRPTSPACSQMPVPPLARGKVKACPH